MKRIIRLVFRLCQCWPFGAHWHTIHHDDRGIAGHWTCTDCGYDSPAIEWPHPPSRSNKRVTTEQAANEEATT